ncbi:MAG: hypothetical protein IJZ37_06945 [Clostridia bacterium]|nr:hypothetical protein [Clostridia bacterium]
MKVKSITYAGKADVYNMEVEDTHNFVIQGGVISHNCADEARYFLMSRPIAPPTVKAKNTFVENPLHQYLDMELRDFR